MITAEVICQSYLLTRLDLIQTCITTSIMWLMGMIMVPVVLTFIVEWTIYSAYLLTTSIYGWVQTMSLVDWGHKTIRLKYILAEERK